MFLPRQIQIRIIFTVYNLLPANVFSFAHYLPRLFSEKTRGIVIAYSLAIVLL